MNTSFRIGYIGFCFQYWLVLLCSPYILLWLQESSQDTKLHEERSSWWFLQSNRRTPKVQPASQQERQTRLLQSQQLIYFPQPELNWMVRLDERIDYGNAVAQSPFDDTIVYLTTYSGSLIALSAKNGDILATVNPTPISRTVDDEKVQQWSILCNSGISFSTTPSGNNFLVYAILDQPPDSPGIDYKPKAYVMSIVSLHSFLLFSQLSGSQTGSCCIDTLSQNHVDISGVTRNS